MERYELTKTGQVRFSHSDGTRDDGLWAFALAVYASRPEVPEYHPVALTVEDPEAKISIKRILIPAYEKIAFRYLRLA